MRFCRWCGFRLGEGVAEYDQTARLRTPTSAAGFGRANSYAEPRMAAGDHPDSGMPPAAFAGGPVVAQGSVYFSDSRRNRSRRMRWLIWPVVGLLFASIGGGRYVVRHGQDGAAARRAIRRATAETAQPSFLGADGLKDAGGAGAFLESSGPPNSPLDKAGIVGGDVITGLDGHPVKGASDLKRLLASTPIAKTVDVTFLRDGVAQQARLTTTSEDEIDRLNDLEDDRPDESKGLIGVGGSLDRVLVPGMSIYGVRLNHIERQGAAEAAGLRDGDIVVEFNGIPVRSRKELESRIKRATPGSAVKVVAMRQGNRIEAPVMVAHEE